METEGKDKMGFKTEKRKERMSNIIMQTCNKHWK